MSQSRHHPDIFPADAVAEARAERERDIERVLFGQGEPEARPPLAAAAGAAGRYLEEHLELLASSEEVAVDYEPDELDEELGVGKRGPLSKP